MDRRTFSKPRSNRTRRSRASRRKRCIASRAGGHPLPDAVPALGHAMDGFSRAAL